MFFNYVDTGQQNIPINFQRSFKQYRVVKPEMFICKLKSCQIIHSRHRWYFHWIMTEQLFFYNIIYYYNYNHKIY